MKQTCIIVKREKTFLLDASSLIAQENQKEQKEENNDRLLKKIEGREKKWKRKNLCEKQERSGKRKLRE